MAASSQEVSSQVPQQVSQLFKTLQEAYGQRNTEAVLALVDPAIEDPPREMLKQGLDQDFGTEKAAPKTWQVLTAVQYGQSWLAQVAETHQEAGGPATTTTKLFVLRPGDAGLRISATYSQPDPNQFSPQTRLYTSRKGRFSLTVPAGWTLASSTVLSAMVADSVTLVASDLQSKVMMGVVQLPMKLADNEAETAQKGAQADLAMEKRMCLNHLVTEQGAVTVAGHGAYRVITEFKAKGTATDRKRMRIYIADDPMLYFFVCDAVGPEKFGGLAPQFEAVVSSFRLLPAEAGVTRQQALAAEQAKGSISGRVYTSQDYNCFIAAPEGWEIRTSPNPAHLVEMQYTRGKSIARLIAAKGMTTDKAEEVVDKRIDQVKSIVQDFSETSRRNVTLRATAGVESLQTFRVQELGLFRVKEVTLIRGGIYYLILCQCIEPDDFAVLEPDFDRIIQSFGFIQ
jgi:hypothetical protein